MNKKRGGRPPLSDRPQLRSPSATPILSSPVTPNRHSQHSPTMKALPRARSEQELAQNKGSLRIRARPEQELAQIPKQTDIHATCRTTQDTQDKAMLRAQIKTTKQTRLGHAQGHQTDRLDRTMPHSGLPDRQNRKATPRAA